MSTVTRIVNLSIKCCVFPSASKSGTVGPLLKKQTFDPEQLKIYNPLSYLPFLSKVTDSVKNIRLHINNFIVQRLHMCC